MDEQKQENKIKLAIVFSHVVHPFELKQLTALDREKISITLISFSSMILFLKDHLMPYGFEFIALSDYEQEPSYLPGLEQVLKDFKIVIIKDRHSLYAYQVLKAKWRYRFHLFVLINNLAPFAFSDKSQSATILKEVSDGATGFIVQTHAARRLLLLEGVEQQRIFHLCPWFEAPFFMDKLSVKKRLGLLESDQIIGYLGGVEWEEGLLDLLYAMKDLFTKKPSYKRRLKLLICGLGSFSHGFKKASVELKLDQNILYLVPNKDAFDALLSCSDAFYVGSLKTKTFGDGDPVRLLSYMQAGAPILAPRWELVEETIGKNRIDFCPSSFSSLSLALEKALSEKNLVASINMKNKRILEEKFKKSSFIRDFKLIQNQQLKPLISIHQEASLDQIILDIEKMVLSRQYLNAVEAIESILKDYVKDLPIHHHANLLRLIGDCLVKLGDPESAKKTYIQSVEMDPYSFKSHIGLGTISLLKQNFEIAVIHFQKSVALAPSDEMALLGLSLSFQGLSEHKEALKWVIKSLEVDLENVAALYTLITISHELSDYQIAEKFLRVYLNLHPSDNDLKYALCGILHKTDKNKEALIIVGELLADSPSDVKFQNLMKDIKKQIEKTSFKSIHA